MGSQGSRLSGDRRGRRGPVATLGPSKSSRMLESSAHSERALADIIRGTGTHHKTSEPLLRSNEDGRKENYAHKKMSWNGSQTTYNLFDLMANGRRASEVSTVDLANVATPAFSRVQHKRKSNSFKNERSNQRQQPTRRSPKKRTRSHSPRRSKKSSPKVAPTPLPATSRKSSNMKKKSSKKFVDVLHKSAGDVSVASVVSNFNVNTRVIAFNDNRDSLLDVGLTHYTNLKSTSKKSQITTNRRLVQMQNPQQALDEAKRQLSSDEWEEEVKALETIAHLAINDPHVLLKADFKTIVKTVVKEVSNLRSQVSRVAVVTMKHLFTHLQKNMETELSKSTDTLINRAADTNKFIREGADEALDAMCERVTLIRAMESVLKHNHHKNIVVRACVARLVDKVTTNLGPERVFGASEQLQELLLGRALLMLLDASLEVRTHAKHAFSSVVKHANFETVFKRTLNKSDQIDLQKAVEALKSTR